MYKCLPKASRTEREPSLKWWELHQEIFASLILLPQSIQKSVHGPDRGKTTVLLVMLEDVFWGWESSWKVKGEILEGRETHRGKSQNMYVSLPHTHTKLADLWTTHMQGRSQRDYCKNSSWKMKELNEDFSYAHCEGDRIGVSVQPS